MGSAQGLVTWPLIIAVQLLVALFMLGSRLRPREGVRWRIPAVVIGALLIALVPFTFFLLRLMPADPVSMMIDPQMSQETIDACKRGEIEQRLEEIKNAAFGEFAEAVASVSLPENGLLSMRGEMTDFAAARRKNSFFTYNWAKKGEEFELCQNGEVVKIASVDEGGIRPLIAIDIKKFDALKGAQ